LGTTRKIVLLAGLTAPLYLLFYYVPISVAHTVELIVVKPLGDWVLESPVGLALFYVAIIAGLFGLYGLGWRLIGKLGSEPLGARAAIYGGVALSMLVLMFLPSLLSKDVFDYIGQGRILAFYHANPFQVPAEAFPQDEFLRAMGWPQFTSLYGPGWVSTSGLLSWLAPGSLLGTFIFYKFFFCAVHIVNGILAGALLKGWGRSRMEGEFLYLWNPLVMFQVVGQAHNDGFLMLWVLLGLFFAQRRTLVRELYDDSLAVICLSISILIKYITAPVLALLLAVRFRDKRGRSGPGRAILLGILAIVVFVSGYLPYASGMDLFHFLRPYQHGAYQGSSLMLLDIAVKKVVGLDERGVYPDHVGDVMLWSSGALMAALALTGLVLFFRIKKEEQIPQYTLFVLLGYILAATALLRVSYGVWLLPLAVLATSGPIRRAAFLATGTLMALEVYWVYAIRALGTDISAHRERMLATLVAVGVPIAYLLADALRRRLRVQPA
jgi:hypothetical protein